mgnify:CR=1 FL=1
MTNITPPAERLCYKCGNVKDSNLFCKGKNLCKPCKSIRNAQFISENPNYHVGRKQRNDSLKRATKSYFLRYPEKYKAKIAVRGIPKEAGYQHHHWSYNDADITDCIQLTGKEHSLVHRHIKYDPSLKLYRIKENGELLDTREKHESFIFGTVLLPLCNRSIKHR